MKGYKICAALVLGLAFVFGLTGCSAPESEAASWDTSPMIVIDGGNFLAPSMPVDELPEWYEYIGELSEEAANDTGLAGCSMYAETERGFADFYLYQECGTPVSEDTVDNTRLQWAYVRWERSDG